MMDVGSLWPAPDRVSGDPLGAAQYCGPALLAGGQVGFLQQPLEGIRGLVQAHISAPGSRRGGVDVVSDRPLLRPQRGDVL
jgi:hypothetical protein